METSFSQKKADMLLKYSKTGKGERKTALGLLCEASPAGNSLLANGNKVFLDLVWLLNSISGAQIISNMVIFLFWNTPTFHNSNSVNKTLSPSPDVLQNESTFCPLQLPDWEVSSLQSDNNKQIHQIRERRSKTKLVWILCAWKTGENGPSIILAVILGKVFQPGQDD